MSPLALEPANAIVRRVRLREKCGIGIDGSALGMHTSY